MSRKAIWAEYWMIDSLARSVTLDRPAGHEIGAYREGWVESAACPGFAIRAEWLWEEHPPKVSGCFSELKGR